MIGTNTNADDPAKTGEVSQVRDVPERAVEEATTPYCHGTMTADESTSGDRENVSEEQGGQNTVLVSERLLIKGGIVVGVETVDRGAVGIRFKSVDGREVNDQVILSRGRAQRLGEELLEVAGDDTQ